MSNNQNEIKTAADLTAFTQSNKDVIGKLVFWSTADAKITRNQMENAFFNAGIPSSFLPERINTNRAFKRALVKIEKQSNSGEKYRGIVITKIIEDDARAVYSIHNRSVDTVAEDTTMVEEDKIYFNKASGTIDYGVKYSQDIQDLLGDCLEFYTGQDIRNIIRNLVLGHAKAISLRERGGMYFVPKQNMAFLSQIQDFIAQTAGGNIWDFPVFDGPDKDKIANLTFQEMADEMLNLRLKVVEAMKNAKYPTVLRNRLEELKLYQAKVDMYSQLLQMDATAMQDVISQSKRELQAVLGLPIDAVVIKSAPTVAPVVAEVVAPKQITIDPPANIPGNPVTVNLAPVAQKPKMSLAALDESGII